MMQETNAWETMLNGEQGVVLNPLLGALERLPCQRSAVESTEALVGHQALRSGQPHSKTSSKALLDRSPGSDPAGIVLGRTEAPQPFVPWTGNFL